MPPLQFTGSCRPVDRIVGAYEFAVDVAARGVLHQGPPGKLGRRKSDWVGTLEVRAAACFGLLLLVLVVCPLARCLN